MQTYEEYLVTMRAYNFNPMDEPLWQSWQIHHHGYYRKIGEPLNEYHSLGV